MTQAPAAAKRVHSPMAPGKQSPKKARTSTGPSTGEGTTTTYEEGGIAITITDVTLTSLKTTTDLNGTAGFHFVADVPIIGTCTFDATAAPFTYAAASNQIKFNAAALTASPSFCAPAALTGTFTLAETSGGALSFD